MGWFGRHAAFFTVLVALILLLLSGCIINRSRVQSWRLVRQDGSGELLVPPDLANADVAQRALKVSVHSEKPNCRSKVGGFGIRVRGNHAIVKVTADSLSRLPTGGLAVWASEVEALNCLAPGEGLKLAARIAESVPLDPGAAVRLLITDERQTGEVDLGPQTKLRVVSPLWREPGTGMIKGPMAVAGDPANDRHLIATAEYTENLVGVETALYELQKRATGIGCKIVPVYAEQNLQGEFGADRSPVVERKSLPAVNYFQFPDDAAFYRLFYKASNTNFTALIVAARTPAELDRRARILEESGESASCERLGDTMCLEVPKDVAVTPMVSVVVNGGQVLVGRGATIRGAIAIANRGQRPSDAILSFLTVDKPWNSEMRPVVFDPSDKAIMNMPLRGGEVINWH